MRVLRVLPRFRRAERTMGRLAARERWPREQIERYQLDRLNDLWARAVAGAPYYRDLVRSGGMPPRFDDLDSFRRQVPVLGKRTIREGGGAFLLAGAARGRGYRTGGSTGEPLAIFWSGSDYRRALTAKYRFYASRGVRLFDPIVFLWGHDEVLPGGLGGRARLLREKASDALRNRRRLSARRLDRAHLQHYLRRIEGFRPTMLYGYSQAVHQLAREAIRTGFRCPSIKLVVLTSETATTAMTAAVELGFGAPAAMEYGAAECPLIAGQGEDGVLRVREDMVLVETPPRSDGRFDIVISVFANTAFPLLRYAIEDVVDHPLLVPDRGFAGLTPVSGRSDDLLVSAGGGTVHPTAIDAVFEAEPAVRRYQVHQGVDGFVHARIELDGPLPAAGRLAMERALAALAAGPARVEVVDRIAPTPAGKHRAIRSERSAVGGS